MKKALLLLSSSLLALGTSQAATLLSLDFGTAANGTEAGFTAQESDGLTHSTIAGNITVSFTNETGFFNRGSSTTTVLYDDFVYRNGGATFTMTLTGAGIAASTAYQLTLFAWDGLGGTNSQTFTGVSGTIGSAAITWAHTDPPTGLYDVTNFDTQTFTSDGTGTITIDITETGWTSGDGPRLNGLIIETIPEPSHFALLGLGGLALMLRRRR